MLWFNCKLTIVAVLCCLSYDGAFGTSLRKQDSNDWDNSLGTDDDDEKWSSDSTDSSNETKDTDSDDDLISGLGLDTDSNQSSKNKTKDTGNDDDLISGLGLDTDSNQSSKNKTKDTGFDNDSTTGDSGFDTDTKKKTDKGSKKKTTKTDKASTNGSKNKKTNSTTDWSSDDDLDTDDSFNWPNDQGSVNNTKTNNVTSSSTNFTSAANSTWQGSKANSTTTSKNSSQTVPSVSSPSTNATAKIPYQNISSTATPNVGTTTPTPDTSETKQSTGYWIPIFNFGNDLYFMTNKGYAQLVNFPAPVIYSFKPVSVGAAGAKPTRGQGQPRDEQEDEFVAGLFQDESNFAECYVTSTMGNLIPYSYFGSWVAVFKLEQNWHLQTYSGLVPLDLTGVEAPVTYEFEPVVYQYSSLQSVPTEAAKQGANDAGLATLSEPVVVEN